MTPDNEASGISEELLRELDLPDLACLRDEVLVLGLRESFKNLATPTAESGPMDHPTKGLVILCGPDCEKLFMGIRPGVVCYFTKFSGGEIDINNHRYFMIKGVDIRVRQNVSVEEANSLARNSF